MTEISPIAALELNQELSLLSDSDQAHGTIHELIEKSKFFTDLDEDEIAMLAVWIKAFNAPTGTMILKEGDPNASLCIIVKGDVNIFKETSHNEHIRIAEISSGASIGEMGVIDGQPLSASAVSSSDSIVLIMTPKDFNNLMTKNSNLGVKILLTLSRLISLRLRTTTRRLADSLAVKGKT
jgi:CRP/FNR family transcriptional regulator, cyclic AMP receptor protein